ncbi:MULTISPECIES: translation initiation factor IF-2 subunit beta [Halomicrobium]|uniref:translation initiation factor IF-2 subunit beta n=1 Tax=Halomicrobium TaxID=203135 RepID=UPI00036D6CE0|nr:MULTISPECIES: translation initiation factor IF-2 subunit beta [Halomicrobium]QGA82810.1 Translation initiation factor 2, beta subunit (eIF-2beta)/eIF-5 N-terminal domain [Halomicrobium sp. LC1Hm]
MDYDEMLDQAVEETPEIEGDGERFEIPDPDLRQEGNATVFENFQSVCDRLSRADEHVMQFLQNEVGTSGHIDESGRARLTGEFRERRIADALDAYADAYVLCPECGLPDTKLKDEQGATVLRCEACGAQSPAGP